MSEPMKDCGDRVVSILCSAISELILSNSALNMEPLPMKPSEDLNYPSNAFLSNTDYWVNHSMVHVRQAIDFINKAIEKVNNL